MEESFYRGSMVRIWFSCRFTEATAAFRLAFLAGKTPKKQMLKSRETKPLTY
jgi:hypothetical protein